MKKLYFFLITEILLVSCAPKFNNKCNDFTLKYSFYDEYRKKVSETLFFDSNTGLYIFKKDFQEKKVYLDFSQKEKNDLCVILKESNLKTGIYINEFTSFDRNYSATYELSINNIATDRKNVIKDNNNFFNFYFKILNIIRNNNNYQQIFPEEFYKE